VEPRKEESQGMLIEMNHREIGCENVKRTVVALKCSMGGENEQQGIYCSNCIIINS